MTTGASPPDARSRLIAGAFAALALSACDENKADVPPPPPMTGRANAVTAKATAATPAPSATAAVAPAGSARQLCVGQSPRPAPKGALKAAAAADATPPPASLPLGVGKWVWINLWAAWCGPCKEEMPRLAAWQEKLRSAGVLIDLAFISMDDDERETRRFLEAQPASGVRATYWLPENERAGWLGALGLKGATQLPVQALVAPSGQVACVIEGAVEDRDYPAIAALVGAKR
jgi:thiol-disulfide isomerase/thioredoxin